MFKLALVLFLVALVAAPLRPHAAPVGAPTPGRFQLFQGPDELDRQHTYRIDTTTGAVWEMSWVPAGNMRVPCWVQMDEDVAAAMRAAEQLRRPSH
jgi:hypothetical protein